MSMFRECTELTVAQKWVGGEMCCNLWGYPCETGVEGEEGKSVILRNCHVIVSLTVGDCFVY